MSALPFDRGRVRPAAARRQWALLSAALLAFGSSSRPADPAPDPRAEAERRGWQAGRLAEDGQFTEAVAVANQQVALARQAYGPMHDRVADALRRLARLQEDAGDFKAAQSTWREACVLETALYPGRHWPADDLRRARARLEHVARMTPAERADLLRAERLGFQAARLEREGQYLQACEPARQQAALVRRLLGADSPEYAAALHRLGWELTQSGQKEAQTTLQQALDGRRRLLGEHHPDYASTLNSLGIYYDKQNQLARSEECHRQALAVREEALGKDSAGVSQSLHNLGWVNFRRGEYRRAEPFMKRAVEIRRQRFGEEDVLYCRSLNNLGYLYLRTGELDRAEPLLRRVLELRVRLLGERHPDSMQSLRNLGDLLGQKLLRQLERHDSAAAAATCAEVCRLARKVNDPADWRLRYLERLQGQLSRQARLAPEQRQRLARAAELLTRAETLARQGQYRQAAAPAQEALAIRKELLGEEDDEYTACLGEVGEIERQRGNYSAAEALFRQACDVRKRVLGDEHALHAESLAKLAALYGEMGDHDQARALLRRVAEILRRAFGEHSAEYARALATLAEADLSAEDLERAERHFRQALAIEKATLGERDPTYAATLADLAMLSLQRDDVDRAAPLLRQALPILQAGGLALPGRATLLYLLSQVKEARGDFAEAQRLRLQAVDAWAGAGGPRSIFTAQGLLELGALAVRRGDRTEAIRLARQAVEHLREVVAATAGAESERQQLATAKFQRRILDGFLSLGTQAPLAVEDTYGEVLRWKGAVFGRQKHQRNLRRLVRTAADPETARLYHEMQETATRLAGLALRPAKAEQQAAWRRQVAELSDRKEALERELARKNAALGKELAREEVTSTRLRASLPAGTVLIDYLEYTHFRPPAPGKVRWPREQRLAAFVVYPGRPIVRAELGATAAIGDAVHDWRERLDGRRDIQKLDEAAARLRRRIWQPLEQHLEGARTILVSPDGALNDFPFAALPGRKPGTYLIEECSVALVPMPQLLPEMLAAPPRGQRDEPPSLLLVGDVDFDAEPGKDSSDAARYAAARATRHGTMQAWPRLQETRGEILAVRDSFEERFAGARVDVLRGAQATEQAVRREAPRHQWLHLATHGFFSPPELASALGPALPNRGGMMDDPFGTAGVVGFHPGLLSGIVLAGANRPGQDGEDDGILTALEVEELDLSRVELVVLSACQTGAGTEAGGEGLLGLQRAFQVAGARTVVASLWKVEDAATRTLMEHFYENLLRKHLSAAEALRQAELWMLHEQRRRGLEPADAPAGAARRPLPTWAAFVLSGDWR